MINEAEYEKRNESRLIDGKNRKNERNNQEERPRLT
jgi:hypothetical protein